MSEYQYYEFLAIDRPLTEEETNALRRISTRAQITPVSFINHYNWGSFGGDPGKLMQQYFDVHVYVANWMTATFMLRLPIAALSQETVKAFRIRYMLDFKSTKTHWIITWYLEESENYRRFGEESGQGWMSRLAPIRDELLRGDIRSLYIGWLAAVTQETIDDDQVEPLPVNGLGDLTPSQQALAEFLEVDPDLLAGAGIGSKKFQTMAVSQEKMDGWIDDLPEKQLKAVIRQIIKGDGLQAVRSLQKDFMAWQRELQKDADIPPQRPVAALWENANKAEKIRLKKAEQKRKQQEVKRRQERENFLKNLSKKTPEMWESLQLTVQRGSGLAYDEVCRSIVDISEAHARFGDRSRFKNEMKKFMAGHMRRKALIQRLVKAGVWKET